jgi:ketosteroid isomerase-like protein
MSRENVEVVRRNAEAFGRNDWEAVLADAPEDVEWVIAEEHPNARTLRGRKEVAAYLRDWGETLSELRFDFYELVDAGGAVVCLGKVTGRVGEGGPEVTVELATVTDFRDGVPVRTREFLDSKAALEAAGLRE